MNTTNSTSLIQYTLLGIKDVFRPKIISLMIIPYIASLLFWIIVGYFTWGSLNQLGLYFYNLGFIQSLVQGLSDYIILTETPFITFVKIFFVLGIIFPLIVITSVLLTSVLLVPTLVSIISKEEYPAVEKRNTWPLNGVMTSILLSVKYFIAWIVTIPLWFLPFGSIIVPFFLLTWFNSKLFVLEVLVELRDSKNSKVFLAENWKNIWILGFFTSIFYFIPFVNFLAPVITASTFTRYCLDQLSRQK